ncbi:MAG TPA: formate dehydrogenase subunit alpha [Candidatus Thermoplasmatota archaeon]|nr:formate dehydrogenase subunit alpha [Candidatus Thermoplasmatota archaeon]
MDVRTICPYCGVGCGLVLRTEGERVAGLRGDALNPVSRGALCPKGATAHEFVHHPDRLATPLVRRDGALSPASWDEAYDVVAEGFARILREHGPDAIGVVSSARATVEENYLAQKFARVVLGTNQVDNCFRVCHSATVTGLIDSIGSGAMSNPIADLALARAFLLVGSNAPRSHPIIWTEYMEKALDAGAALVVVDPRDTIAAKRADVHLPIIPGTEVALFHALAREILASGWQDDAFIEDRVEGLEPLRDAVEPWTPERAGALCGVAPRDLRVAARLYATTKPASIVYGLGVTEHRTGVDNVRALANLALLTGNFGKPGTGVNALRGQNDVQGATDMCRPESLPGYQPWSDPEAVARFERAWGAVLPRPGPEGFLWCSRYWELAAEGALKGAYVIGSDPALTEGDLARVRRGLESLDLLVVQEVFPSETTKLADVVLPSASWAEKDGTFVNSERRVQRVRRAIPPIGASKPDWLILLELAARMGRPLGVAGPEEAFDEMRRLVPSYAGLTWARLDREEGLPWPVPDETHPGTPTLHVDAFPRGRGRLAAVGFFPAAETPDEAWPLVLTTGRTFLQYNAGTMSRRTRMERGEPAAFVEVSAPDARRLGIADGDRVVVATRRGALTTTARVTGIREGVLWMPFHYREAAANELTSNAVDPECGITELKVAAARLAPVGARRPEPADQAGSRIR